MKIICRCEDVTEEEIVAKIKEGYHTIDELKRIIRVTMGLCQGKGCRRHIARIISRELGIPIEKVRQPTYRPPTKPVPIKACMGKSQISNPKQAPIHKRQNTLRANRMSRED